MKGAACRGADPEIFFSEATEDEAKAVCATCPAQVPCLDEALERKEPFGVWGGMNVAERKQILKAVEVRSA